MKKRTEGLIAGILIGALTTGGMTFAANTTTLYNVLANGIKIVVDGTRLIPTDANGNKVEPIIYNGTTYLPVRAVAEAVGKSVYWDNSTYTVYLGENATEGYKETEGLIYIDLTEEYEEMESLISIDDSVWPAEGKELTDNYGNTYQRAITNAHSAYSFEYLLNGQYTRFKATLYVQQGSKSDNNEYLKITADGKTIYTSPTITRSSKPVEIDVDIRGYNDVKIEFSKPYTGKLNMCLGEASFYK